MREKPPLPQSSKKWGEEDKKSEDGPFVHSLPPSSARLSVSERQTVSESVISSAREQVRSVR